MSPLQRGSYDIKQRAYKEQILQFSECKSPNGNVNSASIQRQLNGKMKELM